MKKQKKKVASSSQRSVSVKKTNRSSSVSSVNRATSVVPAVQKNEQKGVIPLGDRVLLKPIRPGETEAKNNFGIIIPETVSKEQPEQGVVVAVGEGRLENGKRIPMQVQVGDTVIFSKYGFDEVKNDGEELYILKEDSILAIIRK